MKYKVVFVAPWAPPFGGISSSLIELVPRLKQLGFDVAVYSRHSKVIHSYVENGVSINKFSISKLFISNPIFVLKSLLIHSSHFSLYSWKKFLRAAITASFINSDLAFSENNIIYITYGTDDLYLAPFLKSYTSTQAVFTTIYAGLFLYPHIYLPHKRFIKYCFDFSDKILSCSKYCASIPEKILGINKPYSHIYNSVDHSLYSPSNDSSLIRSHLSIPPTATVLLFFSRMSADMGTDFVLKHATEWLDLLPNLYIIIAGSSDSLGHDVFQLSSNHSRIKCSFDVTFNEKPFYYAASDIFSAPSKINHPCLGISNIEAMMSENAVLSSDTGGHREVLVDGKSGLLVPFVNSTIDAEKYLYNLQLLVNNPSLRLSLGKAARDYALANFTNQKIASAHVDLIKEVDK